MSTEPSVAARILDPSEIPLLSLADFRSSDPKRQEAFLNALRESLDSIGFLMLSNSGVEDRLLADAYDNVKKFFAKPQEQKDKLLYTKLDQKTYSNVGYFAYRSETAVGSESPDLKEFFHVGPTVTDDNPMSEHYARNVWPEDMPELERCLTELHARFDEVGNTLMDALARAYGLEASYVADLITNNNSVLRSIHYPPVTSESDPKAMRAAPHTGIQLLGLQPRASHRGLQFYTPRGEWVVPPESYEQFIKVNIGEMMAYLLDGQVSATLHRVVNSMSGSEKEDRYSIVHFYHANPTKELRKVGQEGQRGVQAGEWFKARLRELGLFD